MKRIKMLAAGTVGAVVLSVGGLAGTASAQSPADDIPIVIQNLPAAIEVFLDELQTAIDDATATTPPSLVELSEGLVNAVGNTGIALGQGTAQLGALGLGVGLAFFGVQQGLLPFLEAIDDPSTIGTVITADTLSTIIANLPEAIDVAGANLTTALTEGAQGNLFAPGFLDPVSGTPALFGNALAAVGGGLFTPGAVAELVEGTSLSGFGGAVAVTTLVGGAAVGSLLGDVLLDVEAGLEPLFGGL